MHLSIEGSGLVTRRTQHPDHSSGKCCRTTGSAVGAVPDHNDLRFLWQRSHHPPTFTTVTEDSTEIGAWAADVGGMHHYSLTSRAFRFSRQPQCKPTELSPSLPCPRIVYADSGHKSESDRFNFKLHRQVVPATFRTVCAGSGANASPPRPLSNINGAHAWQCLELLQKVCDLAGKVVKGSCGHTLLSWLW